jgi:hypothetical protein
MPKLERGMNESGRLRGPEQPVAVVVNAGIRQRDPTMHFTTNHGVSVIGDCDAFALEPKRQLQIRSRGARNLRVEADLPPFEVRRPAEGLDPSRGEHFQPHCLPDAAGARVPDGMRLSLPVLFASRLREVLWIVERADDNLEDAVSCVCRGGRDVCGKRRVSAAMSRNQLVVDPDGRLVINGPEVQEHAAASDECGRGDATAIPTRRVEAKMSHTAGHRLWGERHFDVAVPLDITGCLTARFCVEHELPDTIERDPSCTRKLRTWIASAQPIARQRHGHLGALMCEAIERERHDLVNDSRLCHFCTEPFPSSRSPMSLRSLGSMPSGPIGDVNCGSSGWSSGRVCRYEGSF